eukprot:9482007-Pyramimonas_sp.AAC.1
MSEEVTNVVESIDAVREMGDKLRGRRVKSQWKRPRHDCFSRGAKFTLTVLLPGGISHALRGYLAREPVSIPELMLKPSQRHNANNHMTRIASNVIQVRPEVAPNSIARQWHGRRKYYCCQRPPPASPPPPP